MTRYEVKWYIAQILVDSCADLNRAQECEKWFRLKMQPNWVGDLRVSIIKIEEV